MRSSRSPSRLALILGYGAQRPFCADWGLEVADTPLPTATLWGQWGPGDTQED